jgi:hypothetical protein
MDTYYQKLKFTIYFLFSRCGGQGDLLSGSLAVFLYWAAKNPDCPEPGPGVIAGWAAARLARACSAQGSTHI